jgi:hypothetical protein
MATTVRTIGTAARQHATIASWEIATDNDLVTSTTIERGEMYDDADFTEAANFAGATVNASYYRDLTAAAGEEYNPSADTGVWDVASSTWLITIAENYFRLSKIGVQNDNGGNSIVFYWTSGSDYSTGFSLFGQRGTGTGAPFQVTNTADNVSLYNCIANGDNNGTTWTGFAADNVAKTNNIYNCICYEINNTGSVGIYWRGNGDCQNNISVGTNGNDFDISVGGTESNNIASDLTAAGAGSLDSQVIADLFTDAPNHDFTLKAGSNAINAGADLSLVFTTDFVENYRFLPWDMGAYAYSINPASGYIGAYLCGHVTSSGYIGAYLFGTPVASGYIGAYLNASILDSVTALASGVQPIVMFPSGQIPVGLPGAALKAYLTNFSASFGFNQSPHGFSMTFAPVGAPEVIHGASGEIPAIGTELSLRVGEFLAKGFVTHAEYNVTGAGTVVAINLEDKRRILKKVKVTTDDLGNTRASGIDL